MLTILENVNGTFTMPLGSEAMTRTEDVVRAIWLKESYAIDRYYWTMRAAWVAGLTAALSMICTLALLQKPPVYKYVLTHSDGSIREIVSLEKPKLDDEALIRWATNAVIKAYTWDFANYKAQFTSLQADMTVFGWEQFKASLEGADNFKAVIENKYVLTAVPNGPVTIAKQGYWSAIGRYTWRVRVPVLVSYASSAQRTNQALMVEALVVRQPEWVNDAGLGIRSIIAEFY
jgi:intracellular multiplication protein IcmL